MHLINRRQVLIAGALGFSACVAKMGSTDQPAVEPVAGADGSPVWTEIPRQTWVVGVPVSLDLQQYCSDPEGQALVFTLEGPLPAGLTFDGRRITGTPTTPTPRTTVPVVADDRS